MNLSERGSSTGIALLLFLLILLGASLYLLWLNLPTEPVDLKIIGGIDNNEESPGNPIYESSGQFYENIRFKDKRISYKIESLCDSKKTSEVKRALSILESRTVLEFYPDSIAPEITVFCSEIEPEPKKDGFFVAGEGGPTEVLNTTLYGVILSGRISFFRDEKCGNPNIALHELLHVLGFNHNNNPNSILYPTLDCKQEIDDSIIEEINRLYSVESLADLRIIKLKATKSGTYLNFDIEVINQGLQDARGVSLKIYADGKFVKEFDLENIGIGTRKILGVNNLRISRGSENVSFAVDEPNTIKEIYENNNRVDLELKT